MFFIGNSDFEHVEQHLNPMSGSCLIANLLLTKIGPRSYHLLERLTKVTNGSFPFFKFENKSTTCSRFLQSFASPFSHSGHCLTIIVGSFHTQSVVHTIDENQKRAVVKVVLEICSTSIKIVIFVESRECPVQTSVKTGTTLIIVTLTT